MKDARRTDAHERRLRPAIPHGAGVSSDTPWSPDRATVALTPKQERFCQEYLVDLNASQAAIRAGYAKKNADVVGPRLLGKVGIALRVRELMGDRSERVEVHQDDVLRELLLVMRSDISAYEVCGGRLAVREGVDPEALRAVASFRVRTRRFTEGQGDAAREVEVEEVEIRLWDKNAAIANAGKHLGLFPNKLSVEDPDAVLARLLGIDRRDLP